MDIRVLLSKMVIFVVLMLVGYAGARQGWLSRDFTKGTSKLVINVFLSATIIGSVTGTRPELSNAELWGIIALMFFVLGFSYVLAAVLVRFMRHSREEAATSELLMGVMNTVFVGLPVLQEVYGPTAVLYLAMSNIAFNVLLYTYGVWRLRCGKGSGGKFSFNFREVFCIPLVATLAALVIFLFDIPLPGVVLSLVNALSPATMPLSMIVIGATLGPVSLLDAFREKRVWLICFFRLVAYPLIIWGILSFFITDAVLLASCVIIAACPSAVVVTVLSLQYKYDAVYSSKGVLASTTLSMLAMPLWVMLLSL